MDIVKYTEKSCPPLLCCYDENSILTLSAVYVSLLVHFTSEPTNNVKKISTFGDSVEFSSIIRRSHRTL